MSESFGGGGHIEGLVGSAVVVFLYPSVDGFLGLVDAVEVAAPEQLGAQGAVEPFYLPDGGGGAGCGESRGDAVLPADPFEEDLTGSDPTAPGEHCPVVRQHLIRRAVTAQCPREGGSDVTG